MAKRPAWTIKNDEIVCMQFEFEWNGGFSIIQKQKNVTNLHNSIANMTGEKALEVSTKGLIPLGKKMGAFSLKLRGISLENVFQSSKKYELDGPFIDLLDVSPKEAKQDKRHTSSGDLVSFIKNGEEWALETKTAFYDYIYITALIESFGQRLDLSNYDWFTDIEFNPNKSINCQARAVAIYKLLQQLGDFEVLKDKVNWVDFHEKYVKS